jgi:hypothetical protein
MSLGSLAIQTTVVTSAAAAEDLKAPSTLRPKIMEVGINLAASTASTYGLGRAGNTPVQTAGVTVLPEDPSDTMASTVAVAWGTAPTVPTNFFRRIGLAGTTGVGVIWTFPRGLVLAASAAMEIWNLATNSAATNVWWTVDE